MTGLVGQPCSKWVANPNLSSPACAVKPPRVKLNIVAIAKRRLTSEACGKIRSKNERDIHVMWWFKVVIRKEELDFIFAVLFRNYHSFHIYHIYLSFSFWAVWRVDAGSPRCREGETSVGRRFRLSRGTEGDRKCQ